MFCYLPSVEVVGGRAGELGFRVKFRVSEMITEVLEQLQQLFRCILVHR